MNKVRKIFWGLFFILSAILVLCSTLGMTIEISLFALISSIILFAVFVESLIHLNFTGILFSLAFCGILYADKLNITQLTPWPILIIAMLCSIGLSILFDGPRKFYKYKKHFNEEEIKEEFFSQSEEGKIDIQVSMGGSVKYINTDNFKVANIDCSFAGVKVYFDKAIIQEENAIINIDASFAGVELYVPREWKIKNNISCVLGGVDEKNNIYLSRSKEEKNKEVILNGKCNLSGVEIIYI